MSRIVVLAEKPSVAREIARVLGCTKKEEGYLSGDGYAVTWALGHLIGQKEPDDLDEKYKRWRVEDLPILPDEIPLKIIRGRKTQFDIIKKLINDKETDSLICATDAGREGELIFRWIYEYAKCKKPFQRLWISSMTDEAIRAGLAGLRPSASYEGLFASAKSRAWADWIVGMNATRAYTVRYGTILSIGRVQTPTLAFLVKRQKEIDAFVPEEYYVITANFGDYKGQWKNPATGKLQCPSKEAADAVTARVRGKTGTIIQAERAEKKQNPPMLYDLTELQRDCNRAFGFTAKKTLAVAQDLYEKRKLITYPRTDSRFLTADVAKKLPDTLRRVQIPELTDAIQTTLAQESLPLGRLINEKRVSDHHALLPTGTRMDFSRLSPDEQKVYDRIVRRAVAALMPPWIYEDVTIVTRVTGETNDDFVARGKVTKSEGWKVLYPTKDAKEEKDLLPDVTEGDTRKITRTGVKKSATTPPAQYTEATLLSAMENAGRQIEEEELRDAMKHCGLGTPATRAAIIERIISTGYAARSGKSLIATKKGMQLISILPEEMTSAVLTGKWEAALADMAEQNIAAGDTARFRESIANFTRFIIDASKKEIGVEFEKAPRKKSGAKKKAASLGVCPLCGKGEVLENTRSFYCSEWKNGCKLTWWKNSLERAGGPTLSAKWIPLLLEKSEIAGSTGTIRVDAAKKLTFVKKESI